MAPRLSFETGTSVDDRPSYCLPPLILHPFADAAGPNKLVESSRASLKLQGLLPAGDSTQEDLDRTLLEGRYSELRMLFYVGKDLARWIEQCVEFVDRQRDEVDAGVTRQSFATLLVHDAPASVQAKLRKWGVGDYRAIFTRALGLQCLFANVPERQVLSDDFVRNYYRYADQMFAMKQGEAEFTLIASRDFKFELYSSGEYSRMLERSWEE
ncbi:MAG TPA: hypothetical protein VNV82_24080 [Bryobacteraceae bacterium]|jgi:hypothetical protein|nr:hypothetical protein [Bryobacteraceae bacterium]